jgi:hypothetical protein
MSKKHVFKGRVLHNGQEFIKGQECPEELLPEMIKAGIVEKLPEPVQPVPAPAVEKRKEARPMPSDKK